MDRNFLLFCIKPESRAILGLDKRETNYLYPPLSKIPAATAQRGFFAAAAQENPLAFLVFVCYDEITPQGILPCRFIISAESADISTKIK